MRRFAVAGVAYGIAGAMTCAGAWGQQAIGRIKLEDATVTGPLEVSGGTAMVRGGVAIVAKDHTAELQLARGGVVAVCQTSSLHVTAANNVSIAAPLLLALDRGALEVRMTATQRDGLMTPDLRLTPKGDGTLDLQMRTTTNGDVCVDNRGDRAPVLVVSEQFGEGRYEVQPGQHVLFEHGSVREVVDRERSPCGCPPAPVISVAKSGVAAAPGQAVAGAGGAVARPGDPVLQAETQHPFPVAESQGLTVATPPAASVPQAPPGQVHAQVAATMQFEAGSETAPGTAATGGEAPVPGGAAETGAAGTGAAGTGAAATAAAPARAGTAGAAVGVPGPASVGSKPLPSASAGPVAPAPSVPAPARTETAAVAQAPPPPKAPGPGDLAHSIGRFFKRIFGGR